IRIRPHHRGGTDHDAARGGAALGRPRRHERGNAGAMLSCRRQFDLLRPQAPHHSQSGARPRSRIDGEARLKRDGITAHVRSLTRNPIARSYYLHVAFSIIRAGLMAIAIATLSAAALGEGFDDTLSRDAVLRDPEIPVLGNPQGDLTVVEYFDYQCPYCKKYAPEIAQVVRDDGKIRLVLKDWPIFGVVSKSAAQLALAAKYQNKYQEAHEALIGAKEKLSDANVSELLAKAGVDVEKAKQDLQAHQKTIEDVLVHNNAQADAFGFQGTPGFIIGFFRVPGVVEMKVFKQIIADARAAAKNRKG